MQYTIIDITAGMNYAEGEEILGEVTAESPDNAILIWIKNNLPDLYAFRNQPDFHLLTKEFDAKEVK